MSTAQPTSATVLRTGSLRRRVTVVVVATVAVMVALLAVTTDLVLSARLEGQLEQRLTDRASIARALAGEVSADDLLQRLEGEGISVRLTTADGETTSRGPLAESSGSGSAAPAPGRPAGPADGPKAAGPVVRTGDLLSVTSRLDDGSVLVLLADASDVRRTLDQVRIALAVGGVGVLVLAAVITGPVVRRVLRPLDQMTATATAITAGDRTRRLRPDRTDTELGRNAAAFDTMLDAVQGAEASARAAETRLRTFLSDAAHELRTPIAGVQAAAERLLRRGPDGDREEFERTSVAVVRESRRASRLVDDLLTTARIDQGLELQRRPVDVPGWAETVLAAKRLTAPDARLSLRNALPTDAATVSGDPDRLAQVLGNLLDNAVRAAGRTGVVSVDLTAADGVVVVDVRDDGPGVPPADAERVFDRLVRLDAGRAAAQGGSGLGLTIARGLARAHGGNLVCLPAPPAEGGHFRLTLPRDDRPPRPPWPSVAAGPR